MKQRLLLLITSLAMAINASAYDFEADGIYYNVVSQDEQTCAVTYRDDDYNSYSGHLAIPATASCGEKGFTVTSIGSPRSQSTRPLSTPTHLMECRRQRPW